MSNAVYSKLDRLLFKFRKGSTFGVFISPIMLEFCPKS